MEENRENIAYLNEYGKKKKKGGKLPKKLRVVFFFLILFGLVYSAYRYQDYLTAEGIAYLYSRVESFLSPDVSETSYDENSMDIALAASGETLIENYKKYLLVVSGDGLRLYNEWGREENSLSILVDSPILETNGKYILLYGKDAKKVFVLHDNNIIKEIGYGNEVISARLGRDGGLVTVSKQSGYKGVISVYNNNLEEIYRWYSAETIINDAAIYDNAKIMAAAEVSQDEGSLSTSIVLFDTSKKEPLCEVPLGNVFVSKLSFKARDHLLAVADTGFFILGGDGGERANVSFNSETLLAADTSNQDFNVFLTRSDTSKIYHVKVYDDNGKLLFAKDSDRKILTVTAKDKKVAVLYPDEIKVFNESGQETGQKALDFSADDIKFLTDHFIAVQSAQTVSIEYI